MDTSTKNKILYFFGGSFFCITTICLFFAYAFFKKSQYVANGETIVIDGTKSNNEMSLLIFKKRIASRLVIAKAAVCAAKILGYSPEIGEYSIPDHASIFDTIKILASSRSVVRKLTIPEGFSVAQTMQRLNENRFLIGQITQIPEEGSLLPDTYCFKYPTQKQTIISLAKNAMQKFLYKAWQNKSPNCALKSPWEALILASIVEKEDSKDRALIAGVYLNRLGKGMRLQSDPTTIYAITRGKPFGRKLLHSDLKIQDPFNTYRFKGLPPTPIANPGRKSIHAVLHPEITDHMFFVADGSSGHVFSKTFDEHKKKISEIKKTLVKKTPDKNLDNGGGNAAI
ncbi:MAG: endolytic transglycosylase MltG [Holosporaceae bacterium]|jgi:UPF0755 protein|nr:endolytic transglycosylase MltG [Holosporaceae bacterium]